MPAKGLCQHVCGGEGLPTNSGVCGGSPWLLRPAPAQLLSGGAGFRAGMKWRGCRERRPQEGMLGAQRLQLSSVLGLLWLAEEVAAPANSWLTRMDGRGSREAGRTGESEGLWRAEAQIQDKAAWCSAREAGWCPC